MSNINYIIGDATDPQGDTPSKAILHICNNAGQWGAGFVLALSAKWPQPEADYRRRFAKDVPKQDRPKLGDWHVNIVQEQPKISVINIVAQDNIRRRIHPRVQYDDLQLALRQIAKSHNTNTTSFHMPRIGCGIGGGDWDVISLLIQDSLVDEGFEVYVYDLPILFD